MANMVFYESWLETVDAFEKMFGIDFAKETIYALVYLSIRGEVKTENDLILGWIKGSCLPNVQSAQEKYRRAVEAGKKGGRPKELDYDEIYRLKENGDSIKEIASKVGLTEDSIKSALKRYNKTCQKGQNHDIDKDIDKEKETDKETDIERGGSDEPLKSANAEKSADAEVKLKVIQLFKKKCKYTEIQKATGLSFDEINSIIKDKERWSWWENEAEQAKEEERSRRSREKQKIEENNMLKIVREHCEEPIDEKEVLKHYCSESMSEWYYSDLLSFFKINPDKKYTRFRDLSNDIQHDKDEAFKSYPY